MEWETIKTILVILMCLASIIFEYILNTLKKGELTWQYFEFIKRQVIL